MHDFFCWIFIKGCSPSYMFFAIIDFLLDIALLSRQKWIIEILALPWNSFSPNWISKKKTWHRNRVSVFQFCRSVKKKWRFLRFLRHANLKRKKIKRKRNFSESPEYFKMRKLVSLTFWFLRERNCNRVCSIEAKFHTDFLSRSFCL